MNPLTCQIAEKNTQTSTQVLICKYDTVQNTQERSAHHLRIAKPYILNTNHKCKYQINL